MSKVPQFIDHIREVILATPIFLQKGFTEQTLYRRYLPQIKAETIQYPCMTLTYDMDMRAKWAPIDYLRLYLTIHMKTFEDVAVILDALADTLHDHKYADCYITIYRLWLEGGPPAPIYDQMTNKWWARLEFSASIA